MKVATIGDRTVPWVYTDVDAEYAAIRTQAALLDLDSVGRLAVEGADADDFLQAVLPRDVEFLYPGLSATCLLLDRDGRPADLLVVYRTDDRLMLETSFGRGTRTARLLGSAATGDVTLRPLEREERVLGIEGPYAWRVIAELFGEEATGLPYQAVSVVVWRDHELLVARTGYTGEYGYKVSGPRAVIDDVWAELVPVVTPAGFAALETAMLEVRQPLLHRELADGSTDSVVAAGLNWLVDIEKASFLGREALVAQVAEGSPERTVGFVAESPAGPAAELGAELGAGAPIAVDALGSFVVGRVVHALHSPGRGTTLGLARIASDWVAAGIDLFAGSSEGRVPVRTISSPYVVPASWSIPIL